jgi:hypothetical protein
MLAAYSRPLFVKQFERSAFAARQGHHGYKGQQPEQGIVTDFFKQEVHEGSQKQRYVGL